MRKLTPRDNAIVAWSLLYAPSAELGDAVGGNDGRTEARRLLLAVEYAELSGDASLINYCKQRLINLKHRGLGNAHALLDWVG